MNDNDPVSTELANRRGFGDTLAGQFAPTGNKVYSTFDPKTKAGASLLIAARLGECRQVESMVGKTILVCDYYAEEVEGHDDKGEVNRWVRLVVFDNDGTAYQCGSIGVRKSLATIAQIRGVGQLNPPVKCTVRQKRTDNKNLFMWLEPDVDDMLSGLPG